MIGNQCRQVNELSFHRITTILLSKLQKAKSQIAYVYILYMNLKKYCASSNEFRKVLVSFLRIREYHSCKYTLVFAVFAFTFKIFDFRNFIQSQLL